jgi:hypothetical protein
LCGAQRGICRVNTLFFNTAACFLYKAKDFSAPSYSGSGKMIIECEADGGMRIGRGN